MSICGSEGMAGAAALSANAAVRVGAGIVDVALPRSIYPIVASNAIEPVYTLLEGTAPHQIQQVLEKLQQATACLIGCGLGQSDEAARLLQAVLQHSKVPVIVDADGINLLAKHIDGLRTASVPIILTPHPGEMARLLQTTTKAVEENRLSLAREFVFGIRCNLSAERA